MLKRQTAYLCLLGHDILERCNKISVQLQSKSSDILQVVYLLKSLKLSKFKILELDLLAYNWRVLHPNRQYKDEKKKENHKIIPWW